MWKQPKYPLKDKKIKKYTVYTYNRISFALKKEGNRALCNNQMNLEDIMLNKIRQSQKDKYCMTLLT